MNPTKNHANASVAGGTTGFAVVAVFVATAFGVPLSPEVATAAGGLLTTTALAIGRKGIRGLWRQLWHGSEPEPPKPELDDETEPMVEHRVQS